MDEETYETSQGDTWDNIALELYGKESYADWLMQNNFWCLDVLVFPEGMVLNAPPLPVSTASGDEERQIKSFPGRRTWTYVTRGPKKGARHPLLSLTGTWTACRS